jgi:ribosomal-protein-alanine N-acetyltransferase
MPVKVSDRWPPLPSLIQTARLHLVVLTVQAAEAVVHGARQPEWHEEYPGGDDVDAASMVGRDRVGAETGWSCRQIERVVDGQVIGTIGFMGPPRHVEDGLEAEVGYGLVPSARGAGLATEALTGMVGAADPVAVQLRATVAVDNVASLRVLDKCGFVVVGTAGNGRLLLRRAARRLEASE